MKTLLLVLLLAVTSCTFNGDFLNIAKCLFQNKKLKENLPKFVEDFKSGDFMNIFKTGISIFSDVKLEVELCLKEPLLKDSCKNNKSFQICIKNQESPSFFVECFNKYCL